MKTVKVKMDISGAFCIFILNVLTGSEDYDINIVVLGFDIKTLLSDSDIEADICGSDPSDNACLFVFTNVFSTVAICIYLL